MMWALFFSLVAQPSPAATAACAAKSPALQKFLSGYAKAYGKADRDALQGMMTGAFWEGFSQAVPKAPSEPGKVVIVRAEEKSGLCFVRWSLRKADKTTPPPTWFELEPAGATWKLAAIVATGPSE